MCAELRSATARPKPGNGRLGETVQPEEGRDVILLKARRYPEPQLLREFIYAELLIIKLLL